VVARIQETTSSVVAFSKSTLSAASAAMEYKDVLLGLAAAYAAVKASQIVGGGVDLAKEKIGAMVASGIWPRPRLSAPWRNSRRWGCLYGALRLMPRAGRR